MKSNLAQQSNNDNLDFTDMSLGWGMTALQEIELNRLIERFRSAVTAHVLCKSVKTAQAVAEARLNLSSFVMKGAK